MGVKLTPARHRAMSKSSVPTWGMHDRHSGHELRSAPQSRSAPDASPPVTRGTVPGGLALIEGRLTRATSGRGARVRRASGRGARGVGALPGPGRGAGDGTGLGDPSSGDNLLSPATICRTVSRLPPVADAISRVLMPISCMDATTSERSARGRRRCDARSPSAAVTSRRCRPTAGFGVLGRKRPTPLRVLRRRSRARGAARVAARPFDLGPFP